MTGPETHRSNARETRRNARARQGQANSGDPAHQARGDKHQHIAPRSDQRPDGARQLADPEPVDRAREALAIAREGGAAASPGDLGGRWSHERFRSPYLRNALWEAGYAVDTLETAVPWASAPALLAELDEITG